MHIFLASPSIKVPAWSRWTAECRRSSRSKARFGNRSASWSELSGSELLSSDQEPPFAHDLLRYRTGGAFGFEPDVEAEAYHVNVRAGSPGRARVLAIGVAEPDVDAGKLFVLQDVADHPLHAQVGADRNLTPAVGVPVGMCISPEVGLRSEEHTSELQSLRH